MEDFIVPAYASFEEFQDNYYWTSQPAYIRNVYYYEDGSNTFPFIVYDDNPEYARATKVVAKGNNVNDDSVSMSSGNNRNRTWQFYEVKKEYQVVPASW